MEAKKIIHEALKGQTKITFEFILDMLKLQDDQVFTKAEVISFIRRCQKMATSNLEKNKP